MCLPKKSHFNKSHLAILIWRVIKIPFCSLAVLDPRVGHIMAILSLFISVLCHSYWLFHGQSCPHIDVVHPGHAWSSSLACTWQCSLHYLFLQATPLFPHGWKMYVPKTTYTVHTYKSGCAAVYQLHRCNDISVFVSSIWSSWGFMACMFIMSGVFSNIVQRVVLYFIYQ